MYFLHKLFHIQRRWTTRENVKVLLIYSHYWFYDVFLFLSVSILTSFFSFLSPFCYTYYVKQVCKLVETMNYPCLSNVSTRESFDSFGNYYCVLLGRVKKQKGINLMCFRTSPCSISLSQHKLSFFSFSLLFYFVFTLVFTIFNFRSKCSSKKHLFGSFTFSDFKIFLMWIRFLLQKMFCKKQTLFRINVDRAHKITIHLQCI